MQRLRGLDWGPVHVSARHMALVLGLRAAHERRLRPAPPRPHPGATRMSERTTKPTTAEERAERRRFLAGLERVLFSDEHLQLRLLDDIRELEERLEAVEKPSNCTCCPECIRVRACRSLSANDGEVE